jgi:hypothetical protein
MCTALPTAPEGSRPLTRVSRFYALLTRQAPCGYREIGMNRRIAIGTVALLAALLVAGWAVLASDAQMYFSSDKNGQTG